MTSALLPPGLHDKSLAQVYDLCVAPFPASSTRSVLFAGLTDFCAAVASFCVPVEIWVDGSFVTDKLDPNDVDIVAQVDQSRFDVLPPEQQEALFNLFWQQQEIRESWHVDAYIFPAGDQEQVAFWLNLYGHSRTGEAKGIIRSQVQP